MVSENEEAERVKSSGKKEKREGRWLDKWEIEDEIYSLNDSAGKSEVGKLQLSFDGVNGLNVCFLVEINREEKNRESRRFAAGGTCTRN